MTRILYQEFEKRATKRHGGKYLYHQDFTVCHVEIRIICPVHGDFKQLPSRHLKEGVCPKCKIEKRKEQSKLFGKEFKEKANEVHKGKYKYFQDYINTMTKVKILCPEHGTFEQRPNNHLQGQGCPKCGKI